MSDLDKLFKKKLEQRSFEFKDAYWQAAEQLIEEQETKRRRRLAWWWTIGLLFFLGLASSIFYYSQVDQAQIINTEDLAEAERLKKEDLRLETNNSTENKAPSGPKENEAKSQNLEIDLTNTISADQGKEIKSGSGYVAESRRSDTIGASAREYNKNNKASEKPKALFNNTSKSISPAKDNTTVFNSDPQAKISEQSYEKSIPKIDTPTTVSKSEEIAPLAALELLETRGLEKLENVTEAEKMDMIVKDFAPKVWSLGLNLSTMYNFSQDYSGYTGLALGANINYKINRHWSVQSGLGYSIRRPENIASVKASSDPNDFVNQVFEELAGGFVSTTNYYNFGLVQVNEITDINQFHFIELPLNLQYRLKRHSLSLGWQLNYLGGIYGEQYLQTSEAIVNTSTNVPEVADLLVQGSSTKGWLDKSRYNKWSSELNLNYGFLLNPRWLINLGAHYQLFENGLVSNKNMETDLANRSSGTYNSNRLYFRLGMQYNIGK